MAAPGSRYPRRGEWNDQGKQVPCHRRSRNDRLHGGRPAGSSWRGETSWCSTTSSGDAERTCSGALTSGKVRLVEGDIRDRSLVAELMTGTDLVFHLAAIRITQCATEPMLALKVLVDGTYEIVEAAAEAGVRKVIASSSASVYGLATQFPTPEDQHPYANDTLYGAAKTFNEGLLRSFHAMKGLNYVALRYFNVYGPRMDIHGLYTEVLIRWMERIEAGQSPLILGDGAQTMDFVFTEDIARANLLAAESDAIDEVFNIGSGTETSLRELADAAAAGDG